MGNLTKNLVLWLVIAMVLMAVFNNFTPKDSRTDVELDYSEFLHDVKQGGVEQVTIDGSSIHGRTRSGQRFVTYSPGDPGLVNDLLEAGVIIKAQKKESTSLLMQIFISWFPLLLLIGVWVFFMRQMQGGGGRGAMSFGRSKAKMLTEDKNKITFADVAGVDEAKEEVGELVEFLSDPSRFQKLGGRIPRGVLMTGSPGTGKTLLAKAIAGEAKVPFFTISGSDFVEMFVGVGASRVRDMFEQGKKHAPCIIFIDEIDAVGRQRGAGLGGGHDEREQTLNQLLVEMDGFEGNEGVIVIAATNRPDVLDPALLRPGRFDRQVHVALPDIRGREAILKVHMRKVPLAEDVEPSIIARGTPGFSGADLANLINEAALFAARGSKKLVSMEEFELAKDKIIMGVERRSLVMPELERKNTAYHESGHTIVARALSPDTDPVHKVTIIPRGRALGVTMQLPEEDRYSHNRDYLLARIAVLMGGRIAEEIFMGQMTTGAANDFEQATDLAQKMVQRWGMSDSLGPRVYGDNDSEIFLGRDVITHKNLSNSTAELVDLEITRIIEEQYARARGIIEANRENIERMAEALLDWETLEANQIDQIMRGEPPDPPSADDNSSGGKTNDLQADAADQNPPDGDTSSSDQPTVKPKMDSPVGDST
ncbi:MAG TPA: ATP-dependent zinc metalloprotease FtsH [Gammaproteobacteria bacterium]|nr:ATP-dependent zinc metalloprotease FtsH [Gammaproteobacteria bacterium]